MKRILFLMMLLLAGSEVAVNAGELNTYREIALNNSAGRDIKGKKSRVDPEDTPVTRGIIRQPVYAYINNSTVSITFEEVFSSATVTVIDDATGETIYSETYSNPSNLNIDLSGENSSNYLIEIEAEDLFLGGHFTL